MIRGSRGFAFALYYWAIIRYSFRYAALNTTLRITLLMTDSNLESLIRITMTDVMVHYQAARARKCSSIIHRLHKLILNLRVVNLIEAFILH